MSITLHCYDNTTFVALYFQAKWLVNYTCNHKIVCVHILHYPCMFASPAIVDHKIYDLIYKVNE